MSQDGTADPLALHRHGLLALLLLAAAAVWAWLLLAGGEGMDMAMSRPTMGLGAALFLTFWVLMMVAMMFPAAAPMILTFQRVQAGRRQNGQAGVPTAVFVAGYILVWSLSGVIAYAAAVLAEAMAVQLDVSAANAARAGGVVLILAGAYQLTPLKERCLSHCRTPLTFIMTSWREGRLGALRMGVQHGLWCFGCCWMLFAVLFPLGLMNVAAMVALTAVVFAEKSLSRGRLVTQAAAVLLIGYGALVIAMPSALPTYMPMHGMVATMPGQGAPAAPMR